MNRRLAAAAVAGIAAVASVGTALALPSQPALRSGDFIFVANQTTSRDFSDGQVVGGDSDVAGGHVIGSDSFQCKPASKTTASCDVTASFKRGQIYGTFVLNFKDGSLKGTVTGGTRTFKGATGTITGTAQSDTQEKVHIKYQVA
jgi:hypothetical protein